MNANFQLIHFLVVSCHVLWITSAQNQDGTLPLPPPDSNAMQDEQQAIAAAMSAAGTGPPVPKNVAANTAGIGLGEADKAAGAGMAGAGGYGAGMPGSSGMAGSGGMGSAGGYDSGGMAGAGGTGGYGMGGAGGHGFSGGGGYGSSGMGGAGGSAGMGGFGGGMTGSGGHGSWGMAAVGSGKTDNEVTEAPKYCYAQGPLLPESLLPKPKQEGAQIDVGDINCEEVVGYLMGLNRFYDRKCSRMGNKCPHKYKYAVSWFGVVGHQIMAKCNIAVL